MSVKIMKKITVVLVLIFAVLLVSANTQVSAKTQVNANTQESILQEQAVIRIAGIDDIINAGTNFISAGEKGANSIANGNVDITPEGFAEEFVDIGTVLVAIGVVTLLIVSLVMAIKWITATPDKQAKLKEQLIGLVIATVVIFGAIGIWRLVQGIAQKTENQLNATSVPSVDPNNSSITYDPEKETKTTTIKP